VTPLVASVGTTHPYAAAGVLLEMAAIRALGARPVAVIAGVSAQTAARVLAQTAVDPATIAAQFAALADARIAAVCVGALPSAEAVAAVVAGLAGLSGVPVICDPVIAASGGDRLADDRTVEAMRALLFPRCTLVTPNLPEAELLTGLRIAGLEAMHDALPALLALGSRAVLLKGGHAAGDPCDLYSDGVRTDAYNAPRLPFELRGTGSLLAAAIATRCAFGAALPDAIASARAFVREQIAAGVDVAGMRLAP
jgi:hydroxymethylpyrimidine/phosphomethylpyrimidine kinase